MIGRMKIGASAGTSQRRRGGVDVVDLSVGLFLTVCLPFLAYVVLLLVQANSPGAEATVEVNRDPPPPDAEEVRIRLEYIRKMYLENAVVFIDRAKREDAIQQFSEIKWALISLQGVKKELTSLEHLITSTGTSSTFQVQLEEISKLKHRVDEGLREAAELDHLGIYRTRK